MNINEIVTSPKDKKLFMLGNEAAVRGVLESGVSLASTYPGTPSSEIGDILYEIALDANVYFEFSANEKVAVEVAASGASSGLRTFAFMKHVGVNVAADSLMTIAYLGVEGSFLLLVADDPSTFSSQNEQDTRHFARQANIPIFEPSNPQELKDIIHYAYDLSDEYNIPVIVRTTTRVSHMRGIVTMDEYSKNEINTGKYENIGLHVPVPEIARTLHKSLVNKIHELQKISSNSPFNKLINNNGSMGIITSGGAYNYVADVVNTYDLNVNILKIGFSHPFPEDLVKQFLIENKEILVIEEVDPLNEMETLAIAGKYNITTNIHGKRDGTLPETLEYTPDIVYAGMKKILKVSGEENTVLTTDILLPERPATLCSGCPHRGAYYSARQAIIELGFDGNSIHPSDIGCYTLGIAPPYNMANYLLSMGSSIGTSCGFSKSTDTNQPIISFIGDSTFFHSGIAPLLNAVHSESKFTTVILDNRITAMTGGQTNPGLPVNGMGQPAPAISIEKIVKAIGVNFVKTINPLNVTEMIEIYKEALNYDGVSVIISKYPCNLINKQEIKNRSKIIVNNEICINCKKCLTHLACPSIKYINDKIEIDQSCTNCAVCTQVCPVNALTKE